MTRLFLRPLPTLTSLGLSTLVPFSMWQAPSRAVRERTVPAGQDGSRVQKKRRCRW